MHEQACGLLMGSSKVKVARERGESFRAPPAILTSFDKEVDHIESKRVVRKPSLPPRTEYLVFWKGLPTSEASWEPIESLWQFKDKVRDFEETPTGTSTD
uniref:Chromo domain-containing protein n=1 Tax=Kalanchoe fedtschenkoi TaxID=63787 RepID=A0A7N0VC45_KALFE